MDVAFMKYFERRDAEAREAELEAREVAKLQAKAAKDPDVMFLMSLAPSLQQLPEDKRDMAKIEISNVIFRMKYPPTSPPPQHQIYQPTPLPHPPPSAFKPRPYVSDIPLPPIPVTARAEQDFIPPRTQPDFPSLPTPVLARMAPQYPPFPPPPPPPPPAQEQQSQNTMARNVFEAMTQADNTFSGPLYQDL
jgi:hypothetical protein